tara:strand:+ start:809 stop:1837 length:1029 start_codon:yes stop_codon:yes gene_type:complete
MAYTTINKPSDYFNTKLYTGNGSTQSVTGVGFQPDWVWLKDRTNAYSHQLTDVIRGNTKYLNSDGTDAEGTASDRVTSFDSDGFSLGSYVGTNTNTANYASWNWLAGGTASSNTDGSITSQVSASTTSGFSIVSYTGTGANATVGHGLGVAPKVVLIKGRSTTLDWVYGGDNIGWTKYLVLNKTDTSGTASTVWNDTAPTSSVFSLGSNAAVNQSGATQIAYCFSEVKGFSKFGSYTGNGNADGSFVYTGFKPAFVIVKRTDNTGSWVITDNKRSAFNEVDKALLADSNIADYTGYDRDFLSNGFKLRTSEASHNQSGGSFIYMAFAENPLVTTGKVPATAR